MLNRRRPCKSPLPLSPASPRAFKSDALRQAALAVYRNTTADEIYVVRLPDVRRRTFPYYVATHPRLG